MLLYSLTREWLLSIKSFRVLKLITTLRLSLLADKFFSIYRAKFVSFGRVNYVLNWCKLGFVFYMLFLLNIGVHLIQIVRTLSLNPFLAWSLRVIVIIFCRKDMILRHEHQLPLGACLGGVRKASGILNILLAPFGDVGSKCHSSLLWIKLVIGDLATSVVERLTQLRVRPKFWSSEESSVIDRVILFFLMESAVSGIIYRAFSFHSFISDKHASLSFRSRTLIYYLVFVSTILNGLEGLKFNGGIDHIS